MMNAQTRLLNTLNGIETDRIPIYTQIPFGVTEDGFKPHAFHGYEDYDDWRELDDEYWKLVRRMENECDNFFIWRPKCMLSEPFFIPLSLTEKEQSPDKDGNVKMTQKLKAGKLCLTQKKAVKPGTGHTWEIEHFCKTVEDAKGLLDLPWDGHLVSAEDYYDVKKKLGDKGVIWVTVPSPLLVVCRLFDPADFLLFVATERELIGKLMDIAYTRIYKNLEALLKLGAGPIVRFGGAEHATPPLMSPRDFDWLVVGYDKPLMDLCKSYGVKIAVHCHGRIKHALKRFVEMGVDQTDPVETIPDGDITVSEAREIAGDKITLTGNIQMRELYNDNPLLIEQRVKSLIKEAGPKKLIITTTGTPLEKINERVAMNYHRLIDTVLKYGSY